MRISQVSDHVGALVEDVDITQLTDSEAKRLVDAWGEHGALFFRGQTLDEQQHIDFAERFSLIDINKFFTPIEGHPQIAHVLKEPDHAVNVGGGWHTGRKPLYVNATFTTHFVRWTPQESAPLLSFLCQHIALAGEELGGAA